MKESHIVRYEKFGGIVATEKPPMLAFVDKEYIRHHFNTASRLWEEKWNNVLSGPVEAHYAVTNYCPSQCPGCYMSSENRSDLRVDDQKDLARAKKIADRLAEVGIFHVALGGGESFSVPWFTELAAHFRTKGIIPNVTTSGHYLNRENIERCSVFGQVNVSLDGIGDGYNPLRPDGHFKKADEAIGLLKKQGLRAGINCVISRHNFDSLEKIVKYAKSMGLVDIEFLRFKPAGRGKDIYHEMALTENQAIKLFPKMKRMAWRYRVNLKLDCSFTPFVCYHKPSKRVLEYFSIMGCDAGNWLIGVSPEGKVSPCSFIEEADICIDDLKNVWGKNETYASYRFWDKHPKGDCSLCGYLSICNGGCHAVSRFITGDYDNPDPECPIILKKRTV